MKNILIKVYIGLFFLVSSSFAEPIQAASYLGMCNPNFPCDTGIDGVNAIGYLADAFGHRCECVERFLQKPGDKYIRVHLANATCFPERRRRCGRRDVFYRETMRSAERKIRQKNKRLLRSYEASVIRTKKLLSAADSNTTIRYSLALEAPFSYRARSILLKLAKKHLPEDALVDSVLFQKCLHGLICERHGDSMAYAQDERCISDTDGLNFFEADLDRFRQSSQQCEAIFYWSRGFNLLPYANGVGFIYPDKRSYRAEDWEFEKLKLCLEQ